MGGDGGTLNNSRADHVRMRAELGGYTDAQALSSARARERASVSVCAASRQRLAPPVVVDRLGQLFNKDALIAVMLDREGGGGGKFEHVRSLGKDAAPVGDWGFCKVTRETVSERGRFVVGWRCGCVVAMKAVEAVRGEGVCVGCGEATEVVGLGLTGEERDRIAAEIAAERRMRKRKRKRVHGE